MPWVMRGKKEKFVPQEMPPTPHLQKLSPEKERDPETTLIRARERVIRLIYTQRLMSDWYKLYDVCPRKACRRARACTAPYDRPPAFCHTPEVHQLMQQEVYPKFFAALEAQKAKDRAAAELGAGQHDVNRQS